MKDRLAQVWRWVKWPLFIVAITYAALVVWRVFVLFDIDKTNAAVAAIHAQKITLADVTGENLPPVPDQAESDATVAGIDKNNNGIRDDVELAIFAKYPNSAKIRAAELQYAMALQLMLTKVTNSETWIAAAKEVSRGAACVGETIPDRNFKIYLERTNEVDQMVINTPVRHVANDRAHDYTTSYGLPNTDLCNVELNTLPN